MIEHTISKYKLPIVVAETIPKYSHAWQRQEWNKDRCLQHIEALKMLGFVVGKHVTSKYGLTGIITGYRDIPENGIHFYGATTPDVIRVSRTTATGGNTTLTYTLEDLLESKDLQLC